MKLLALRLKNSKVDTDPPTGSLLCWSGEAWKIGGIDILDNDTEAIFNLLLKAAQSNDIDDNIDNHRGEKELQGLLYVIASIAGPFAFVFYDARHKRVIYGRDALGRRSLLMSRTQNGSLAISSVCDEGDPQSWAEIEPDGIYVLDLTYDVNECLDPANNHAHDRKGIPRSLHIPWTHEDRVSQRGQKLASPFPCFNKTLPGPSFSNLIPSSPAIGDLACHLQASLGVRVKSVPVPPSTEANPARVATLFSGGLDCTLIARLIHDLLPLEMEIDLLNVAFENPRVVQAAAAGGQPNSMASSVYSLCPDRITGLSSHAELVSLCPGRKWRFVTIDIPYLETVAHRPQIISLIHPHNTEMDLSVACALYFAARGRGSVQETTFGSTAPYSTPARVLFSGLGADELFGGYTRHATAFSRRGYQGLVDELALDFNRLGKRNLGRDDRVMSHWGREVRYPYLDEDLVSWALSIPVWEKCAFGQGDGHEGPALDPAKRLLRLLAWKLGLRGAAAEKKRAIQFGARTAKMEMGKIKGTQILS